LKSREKGAKVIKLDKIVTGKEYYFFFTNYFCAGFYVGCDGDLVELKNGHFDLSLQSVDGGERIFPFETAHIDAESVVGFAST